MHQFQTFTLVALVLRVLLLPTGLAAQTCALDVFVANDQSGSVSAIENTQSRQFISALFQGMQPWGTGAGESRMAIADWDSPGVWLQFTFPVAGQSYTTLLPDVLAYQSAPRALLGGTDPVTALTNAYQQLYQAPIPGRVARPVIVLMTDAACSQVPAGLSTLAAQIKNAGVYIVVVAIEAASTCPSLAGVNVASPGGYFSAPTYADLVQANVQLVQDMINAGCAGSVDPSYDLAIGIDAFTASGCNTGSPVYTVDYTITNGPGADFSGPLTITFYDGDPMLATTTLLAVQNVGATTITAGGTYTGSFSSAALGATTVLYAIVNFNGALPGNGTPVLGMSSTDMVVADEWITFNNRSARADRVSDPVTCPPQALLYTDIVSGGTGCDDIVPYEITICNNGDAAAYITPTLPISVPGAVLITNLNQPGTYASELDWATYYGGTLLEEGSAVATDPAGNVYIAGVTRSTGSISTPGSHLAAAPANRNAFLAKFNSAGVRQWATYYGGAGADYGMGVTTDAAGNVYLVGFTESTAGIATAGTYQTAFAGSTDAFIVKFNSAGVRQWGTYFGGTEVEEGYSVAVDNAGGVYVAGMTDGSTNLASVGAHQAAFAGISDQFLVKFNATTGARLWSTYYGGPDEDIEAGVACDPTGNVYLTGQVNSATGIASAGAFQTVYTGNPDVYLACFNSIGTRQWATYFGGLETEEMPSVVCDASGDILLAGTTDSDDGIAYNALHQGFRAGSKDGFVAKFDGAGNVVWGTYVGGTDTEDLTDVAVDPTGKVLVAGFTQSPDGIATLGSYKENIDAVSDDAFVVKLFGDGTLDWGSYFGGDDDEENYSIAVDPAGDVYLAGFTPSLIEVATTGAHQTVNNGNDDAYLAKFGEHELPRILYPGECFVRQYVYDYSAVAAGTYDLSLGLTAAVFNVGDPAPLIMPDQNFNAGGFVNISGFNGAVHTGDNAVIPVTGTICPTGDQIIVSVNIPTVSSCGNGNYAQAMVTISNLSGVTVSNTDLHLNLVGTGATFVGEPYNLTNGLILAAPDLLDPLYPAVPYALNGQSADQFLPILTIPSGVSTFQVDLNIGSTLTNLFAQVDSIHTNFNATGQSNLASDATGVSALTVPVINNFNCPGSVLSGANIVFSGISVSGASTVQWASTTVQVLAGGGAVSAPTLTYAPTPQDVANGFVAISLTALSAAGCDAAVTCQVDITNVAYDYGDAPVVYDMNINYQPPAAASTLFTGMLLGTVGPSTETIAHNSVLADGDGFEEDALPSNPYTAAWPGIGGNLDLPVTSTNNTSAVGYLHGYVDWNADGDFLDSLESSFNTVVRPPASGTASVLLHFEVPPFANTAGLFYIRLRLSIDEAAVNFPYMAAARGETEDYVWESIGVLPVTMLSFQAKDEGAGVAVEWVTASEQNTHHFELERSADAYHYSVLTTVAAAGHSVSTTTYHHLDEQPLNGMAYYRLKQVDADGSSIYHGPVTIEHPTVLTTWLEVLPHDALVVHAPELGPVELWDATGRPIFEGRTDHGRVSIATLAPGAYILVHRTGSTTVHRFVVD